MKRPPLLSEKKKTWGFRNLSIRRRLPLLICILLVSTVMTLGWLSQIGVRKAAFEMGKERLGSLTQQLSSLYGQSAVAIKAMTRASAAQPVIKHLLTNDTGVRDTALQYLDKLRPDSSWVLVELFDASKKSVLQSFATAKSLALPSEKAVNEAKLAPDSCSVGKLVYMKDSIYFPIIAAVTENKSIIGYLVRWRVQIITAKALAQFSELIGTHATLYMGNADGSLWTNMMQVVPAPATDILFHSFFAYDRPEKGRVIASAEKVPDTQWAMVIEFPESVILEPSRRFFPWIITIGAILVCIGIILTSIMSRHITHPLHKLTAASTAMAAGDYSVSVPETRNDELGKLAAAFNRMTIQVKNAQLMLEKTVDERTQQLYAANAELEAFSYSVSHDLRAPLRYISGYAKMLREDYGPQLDDEAHRITEKIIGSAQNMGQLIDDLISFSQVSRKALKKQHVNMNALAKECVAELLQYVITDKYKITIHPMPDCYGDAPLIRQVWINLIGNAIKYSGKKNSPEIDIGFSSGGSEPVYYIRDNGAGFDMEYVGKLFGVFQRLHDESEFHGSGIGLSLVKRILTRHGGDIRAEGTPGAGATFFFSVPPADPVSTSSAMAAAYV